MSIYRHYRFIDRTVVDPLLKMKWEEMIVTSQRMEDALDELIDELLEDVDDTDEFFDNLGKRTFRWTVKHSEFGANNCLERLIDIFDSTIDRCPIVSLDIYNRTSAPFTVPIATAIDAFLSKKIEEKTLWAVYNINGSYDPRGYLNISDEDLWDVNVALGYGAVNKPLYPWFPESSVDEGYQTLGILDTKRFLRFMKEAWEENWPVPRLKKAIRKDLDWQGRKHPRFRDFQVHEHVIELTDEVEDAKFCTLQFNEELVM